VDGLEIDNSSNFTYPSPRLMGRGCCGSGDIMSGAIGELIGGVGGGSKPAWEGCAIVVIGDRGDGGSRLGAAFDAQSMSYL
jgi:hypothetical protein